MATRSTIAFVHAHPDDEALFTSGASRWYADHGYRVILITCTNGSLGLDPQVRIGNDPLHDASATTVTRAGELAASAALIGVERLVQLGYGDSGMTGWPQNRDATSFVNASVDSVAQMLATIFDEEEAKVVVTYDEYGYYGHPDHIHAHLVTRRAMELSDSPQRLYYPVTPRALLEQFVPAARAKGVFLPTWVLDAGVGVADSDVSVTMDVTSVAKVKQASIAAHASQVDNADLVTMDAELFKLLFGHEYYMLGWSRADVAGTFDDLFGGLK